MFDDYSATLPLLIVVLLENIAVAWVYGTDKYVTNSGSIRELTAPSGGMMSDVFISRELSTTFIY